MSAFVPFQIVHPGSRELQDPNRSSRKFGPVALAPNGGATSETATRPMSKPTRRTGSRATRFLVLIPPRTRRTVIVRADIYRFRDGSRSGGANGGSAGDERPGAAACTSF